MLVPEARPPRRPASVVSMTVAEPRAAAPTAGSIAFVTVHRGAHDEVGVQSPAPLLKLPLSEEVSTS
jgi:hypothetical protein